MLYLNVVVVKDCRGRIDASSSELLEEFIPAHPDLIEYSFQQSALDLLSCMHRNHSCPSVCVFKESVASFLTDWLET